MGQHLHGGGGLLAQLEQLLVALLDLLVERLVLNLELLKVDEVQACDHAELQAGHGGAAGWVARGGLQAGWHGVVAAARPRRTVGELLLLAQRALELAQDVAPVDVGETQLLDLLVLAVLLLLEALDELAGDGLACSG